MDHVEISEVQETNQFKIVIGNSEVGVFVQFEGDRYSYFAKRQEKLTGDDYIAIGTALNELTPSTASELAFVELPQFGQIQVRCGDTVYGVFDNLDGEEFCFFPRHQELITGSNYIEIGTFLNSTNPVK